MVSTGCRKEALRAVVGQRATLKADHTHSCQRHLYRLRRVVRLVPDDADASRMTSSRQLLKPWDQPRRLAVETLDGKRT